MARLVTVNDIINRAAVEVGLNAATDPVSSTDENFVQLKTLLNGAGQELVELHSWQILNGKYELTTQAGDSGTYDLPDDFNSMIDQTGWDRTNRVAIGGPLSSQDWSYLAGRDLVSQSIYASFRLDNNKLELYPQPPPEGLLITFEYLSTDWLAQQTDTSVRFDLIQTGSDVCLFHPLMTIKLLKCKWLEAKGFDSTSARLEFETIFGSRTGKDEGGAILSASRSGRSFPYLSSYGSTGDTNYGH